MKGLDIDIGEIVKNRIAEVGMTKAEFGRRMNTSRQNVNTLLRKQDWSVQQVLLASISLETNFFQPYWEYLKAEFGELPSGNDEVRQSLSLSLVLKDSREMAGLLDRLEEMRREG